MRAEWIARGVPSVPGTLVHRWQLHGSIHPKHVVVSIINRIDDSRVLTHATPSLIAYKTMGMTDLKIVTGKNFG